MIKCPFCAEDIHTDAIKCKHCGEWIKKAPDSAIEKHKSSQIKSKQTNHMRCDNCGVEYSSEYFTKNETICNECTEKIRITEPIINQSDISNRSISQPTKLKQLGMAFLRIIGFSMGAVLILGIYTALVAPLNPIRLIFMIIGIILMVAYSWLSVREFKKGGYSAASTVGQLCISFLLVTFQFMRSAHIVTEELQASISSKMFIGLLIIYIVLKVRHKTKNRNGDGSN